MLKMDKKYKKIEVVMIELNYLLYLPLIYLYFC